MGGPSVQQFYFKDDHSPVYDYTRFDVDSPAAYRRSIYGFIVRSVPDPFMEAWIAPTPRCWPQSATRRSRRCRRLASLNNPFVLTPVRSICAARLAASGHECLMPVTARLALWLS